jgi:hypothetical protein
MSTGIYLTQLAKKLLDWHASAGNTIAGAGECIRFNWSIAGPNINIQHTQVNTL